MPIAPIANGIEYETRGDPVNPALLLVAGLGAGISSWALTLPTYNLFNRRPCYLVAYDPRGLYGSGDVDDYPFSALVEDARDLLDHLGIEKAHVVGWSMGGVVAQVLGSTHPERVDRLILLATAPKSPTAPELEEFNRVMQDMLGMPANPAPEDYQRVLGEIAGRSFNHKLLGWLIGKLTGFVKMADPDYYEDIAQQWRALEPVEAYDALQRITAPTLVVHGANDRLVPRMAADLIYDKLRCPKRKVIIPGGSHACAMENFPKVNGAIRGWLNE